MFVSFVLQENEKLCNLKMELETDNILRAIIDHAVEGIITINEKGIVESFNPAASRLFGYSAEEVVGKNVNFLMQEPDKSKHDNYILNYLKTGNAKIIGIGREVIALRKNGSWVPISLSISEVKLGSRTIFTGLIRDISAQKDAEEKLKRYAAEVEKLNRYLESRVEERTLELEKAMVALSKSNEDLEKSLEKEMELNEMKSKFVTIASHEFRTPLSTILSSATLISRYKNAEDDEKRVKHINRIKSSVENLTEILDDFLSLSKLEEGVVKYNETHFDLVHFCDEVTEEMSSICKAGQKLVYEHFGTSDEVLLDKQLLRNVVINLLSNAIKFSPENSRIEFKTIKNGHLEIEIKDSGIGIPAKDQKHLFDRFFRASNANNIQGTGLGLHIVKKYVELMDGNINFKSTFGQGTTFTINLKANKQP